MGTNQRDKKRKLIGKWVTACFFTLLFAGLVYALVSKDSSRTITARFERDGHVGKALVLELADTPQKRELGLMYRKQLAPNHGMIFVFPEEAVQSFWMKNTYISLDMIFLNKDLKVVGILESVPILNSEMRKIEKVSQYVVEINALEAEKLQIAEGDQLNILRGKEKLVKF